MLTLINQMKFFLTLMFAALLTGATAINTTVDLSSQVDKRENVKAAKQATCDARKNARAARRIVRQARKDLKRARHAVKTAKKEVKSCKKCNRRGLTTPSHEECEESETSEE